MSARDWIHFGYGMGAIVALIAAMVERRRGDRAAMLVCLLGALGLLVASRMYGGGLRMFDYAASIGATFLGTGLLANASLRPRQSKPRAPGS